MKCNYCQNHIIKNLSIREIFFLQKTEMNQLCLACLSKFSRLSTKDRCFGCCRSSKNKYCEECQRWQQLYPTYLFHHEALFSYNEAMHDWFKEYKFKGNYALRYSFAPWIKNYFKQKKNWLVIPIPISDKRMEIRKFNQVEGLLKGAGVPFSNYLIRKDAGKAQVEKTRKERLKLKQPFILSEEGQEAIRNQQIILVDDIYTTGRTMFHGATVILKNNPSQLYTFSLSR